MPIESTWVYPKPKDWDEFENIVWDLFRREWQDPDSQRYGRSGQEQHGVDIFGRPREMGGLFVGVQCKRYEDGKLTEKTIRSEIGKVEKGIITGFLPFRPARFIIATTASRDVKLQDAIVRINEEREMTGVFTVSLLFWEDLSDMLADPENQDLRRKHYPTISQADQKAEGSYIVQAGSVIVQSSALRGEHALVQRAALIAALIALASLLVMGFVIRPPEQWVDLQPSFPPGTTTEFLWPINNYPELVLRFATVDTLFVFSYLVVFVGLYASILDRSPTLARIGLGFAVVTALSDAAENVFFVTYSLSAQNGIPLIDPALPLIYILATLKLLGSYAALFVFGLAWSRVTRLGWVISGIILGFVLLGLLGGFQLMASLRGLFFLISMPIFAIHFWSEIRRQL